MKSVWWTAAGLAVPVLLGGVLSVDRADLERWPEAGAWRMPVGPAYESPRSGAARPEFRLLRGLQGSPRRWTHEGADLGNGREGDSVFAAATGLVLFCGPDGGSGFGDHAVLAHRTSDGALAYSVYAHMLPGSIRVTRGDVVEAGGVIGRVGSTGRASAPHLHFEVRRPVDPTVRWENADILDPLEWVNDRLPLARLDSSWARPYLEWAENGGLLPGGVASDEPLTRADWWHILAGATRTPGLHARTRSLDLRDSLIAWSVLPEESAEDAPHEVATWAELTRDLRHLDDDELRLAPCPVPESRHRECCERVLGDPRPAHAWRAIEHLPGPPTLGQACLLLAELGPAPRTAAPAPHAAKAETRRKKPHRRR